jgi:hypothetical protein
MTTRAGDGRAARTFALSPGEQDRRVRAERDAYANRLATAERDNARLRAENARLWQIIADAFDHTLNQPEETK